jgi:hypothetical protein
VSAHIRRPEKHVVDVQGCSALPVIGGHHENNVEATTHKEWVSHGPIATSAHGDYVDAAAGVGTTLGTVAFDEAPTQTRVKSRVEDLSILGRVHIGLAAMGLVSHSQVGTAQSVILLEGCQLEDVRVDEYRLKIALADDLYCECDTLDKLAAKHAAGLPADHEGILLPADSKATTVKEFPIAKGIVKCTIVKKIEWDGAAHPDAEIHGHVVRVKNFGRIYFGEMFITDHSRRLNMVRFQLGSDVGGEVTCACGETNGGTWPPT